MASRIAAARNLSGVALLGTLTETLTALGLPTRLPDGIEPDEVVERTRADKKRERGRRRMVRPLTSGGAGLFDVDDGELRAALVT